MVRDHDVLFPTAILDGEASTIIGVQLADGLVDDMEFICRITIAVDGDDFYVLSSWVLCELIGGLGSVDWTPCCICVMCPLMVSADSGKYLDALA